jgi:hypothetical protein
LVSLQKWTPFFWEQDRIGMLVPLLTMPIRDPLLNLLTQDAIYVFTALAAMFLLARYILPDGSYALAGALSAVAFLGLASATWVFNFTACTFYGVWLALGLGGLVLTQSRPGMPTAWWRWLIALGLLVLAHWVYSATAILLGPLVVTRFFLCGWGTMRHDARGENGPPKVLRATIWQWFRHTLVSEFGGQLVLVGVGLAAGVLFLRWADRSAPYHTNLGSVSATQWPRLWRQHWHNGWSELAPHHWPYFLLGSGFVALLQLSVPSKRRQASVAWRAALAAALAGLVYFLFVGTRQFLSSCVGRYTYPCFFLWQGALIIFATGQLMPVITDRLYRRQYVLAAVGMFLAALINFHSPSIKKVHQDLAQTFGGRTADVLAAHCTHVAGDYWKVWPSVFHANLMLREQGKSETIWGITMRGEPTHDQWKDLPLERLRIAVPLEDQGIAQFWFQAFHLPPMVVVEQRPTIYVLRPAAVVLQEQQQKSVGVQLLSSAGREE